MPGVSVFLDVDDLTDIGELETCGRPPFEHTRQLSADGWRGLLTPALALRVRVPLALSDVEKTATVMIFVSKGYFKSTNCLREADCTVAKNKHIALMFDPVKGGAPLEVIKEDECPEHLLGPIFMCPDRGLPLSLPGEIAARQLMLSKKVRSSCRCNPCASGPCSCTQVVTLLTATCVCLLAH